MLVKRKHTAKPVSVEVLCNHSVNMTTQLISMHAANPAKINIMIWVSLLIIKVATMSSHFKLERFYI